MSMPAGGVRLAMVSGLAAIAVAGSAAAVEVTLNAGTGGAGDAINTSSFAAALNWSNALAPAAGNSYVVPTGRSLRTTLDAGTDLTFAGDSLSVVGSLVYKSGNAAANINTVTINNFSLNGGTVNNASNFSAPFILTGNSITILGTGTSTLFANNGTITVNAPLAGTTGTLALAANGTTAGRQIVLGAANTYTGNILVSGASGAVLSPAGKLAFKIGANGVNNSITGASPFVFEGAFTIDLTTAGNTVGNSWTLVDVSTVVETFADSFAIEGFTERMRGNNCTSAPGISMRSPTATMIRTGSPTCWNTRAAPIPTTPPLSPTPISTVSTTVGKSTSSTTSRRRRPTGIRTVTTIATPSNTRRALPLHPPPATRTPTTAAPAMG
ncbi:MAG: hypothetical protein EOP88_20160 [Verrucomicrobiaceae bacterium]|nr:MAG: hypothetical protein EOP88_20160 [Verrucomicrobiaceae bacterium]